MRKLTDFIICKRYFIMVLFIVLSIVSLYISKNIKINYDLAEYLPSTSETRIGMDIMNDNIDSPESSSMNLMLKDLNDEEKLKVKQYLENIEGISSIDYDETEKYNKENYTLYIINIDDSEESELAARIYKEITEHFTKDEFYISGAIAERNKPVLPLWIAMLAVFCALLILIFMSGSYVEPFLFLLAILVAVILNKGTNIIFKTISNITDSISAILQLALSMDYSIMLMNRYNQEKEKNSDKIAAMKEALFNAFTSIASSSVTTIVGLLALVFMSFTIGRDLGFVLAKGVLFSLVSIFFVLPGLILMCDDLINKTKKKSLHFDLTFLGKYSYKIRPISIFLFMFAIGISLYSKGSLRILYTESEENEVSKIFTENNQMAIIYPNSEENQMASILTELEKEEKVDEVLGYGNTINQNLKYDELTEKFEDLGQSIDIEDYLLKVIYYNYYNREEDNKITFNEFVNFIQTKVNETEDLKDELDEEAQNNIDRLAEFTTEEAINKPRASAEIADLLEIEKAEIEDVFILYNSKNNKLSLTVKEFIDFVNKDVLTNPDYSGKISKKDRDDLNKLLKFTDSSTNNTKMTSSKIAELFGMEANSISDLYKYYILVNETNIKMSIAQFSSFVLNDVLHDSQYASIFDETTINNIKMLNMFSNLSIIKKPSNSLELSNIFMLPEDNVKQLLLLKYSQNDTGTTYSISEFINNVVFLKNNTNYLAGADLSSIELLSIFSQNNNNINITPMNKENLSAIFGNIRKGFVENIYLFAGLGDDYKMSPQEFVNLVLQLLARPVNADLDEPAFVLDDETLNKLKLLKLVIDDTTMEAKTKYSSSQISQILKIPQVQTYQLYALMDYVTNNTTNWTSTPNEFVNLILSNLSNPVIASSITEDTVSMLNLLSTIMTSTINNTSYNYTDLAGLIGSKSSDIGNIYKLYEVKNNTLSLTPNEFVDFILAHRGDETLSNRLSSNMISDLELVKSVMKNVKKKYSSLELSNLLGLNKKELDLLYGLYVSNYVKIDQKMSLQSFVEFLLNEVITDSEYSERFESDKQSKLNTIDGIMKNSILNTEYTKDEIFTILTVLTDTLDKKTVDLLYIYYGSDNQYDESWELTIQDFVNFLNNNILNDERFSNFIEDDMRQKILDSKDTIKDAKKLLVGNGYSRVVLNTKLELESDETFETIQRIKDKLGENLNEFYIIGDSPMAYEMSKTFSEELNFITILTMIAIFIVVAITFKSIIIPLILVLTIQCAVYLTMGILAISGGTVYFIALLIVQSILMGATIDYAILYTSYYLEHRRTMGIKEAIINSYNQSIHAIATSALILIIVTLIVGHFSAAITSKICTTISKGTMCSTVLILLLLPAVIASVDKIIIKKNTIENGGYNGK